MIPSTAQQRSAGGGKHADPDDGNATVPTQPAEPTTEPRSQPRAEQRTLPARPPNRTSLGPLLAVAGLCGGAGASTLAYLVARNAASTLGRPVLVCDTGGPGGGLAAYSRVDVPRSLPRIANAVAAHEALAGGLFGDDGSGLRVMASRPQLDVEAHAEGVVRVLEDARAAHGLTVVDCGTLSSELERHVLEAASHIAWIMPATLAGIARSEGVLALFGLDASRQEVLVARRDHTEQKPPMRELTLLADSRRAPLVLMPSVPDLVERPVGEALEAAALTLDAVQSVITR